MFNTKRLIVLAGLAILMSVGFVTGQEPVEVQEQEVAPATDAQMETSKSPWSIEGLGSDSQRYEASSKLMKNFVIAISLVIVFGWGAYYFSKKLGGRFTTVKGKNISVVETVALGPQKALHLIQVGGSQTLLVGVTNEVVNLLADVTETLSSEVKSKAANG